MKKVLSLLIACMLMLPAFSFAEGNGEITLICDGTANYKLEAEGREKVKAFLKKDIINII